MACVPENITTWVEPDYDLKNPFITRPGDDDYVEECKVPGRNAWIFQGAKYHIMEEWENELGWDTQLLLTQKNF